MDRRRSGGFRLGFLLGVIVGAAAMFVATARGGEADQGSLGSRAEQLRARLRSKIDEVSAQARQALEEGRQAAIELREEFEATLQAAQRD